jgi:hypothetical protein
MSFVGEDQSATRRHVTVAEAAQVLDLSVEAVRGRIKRDTLAHEKASDGTVYVLLDVDQSQPVADQPTDRTDLLIAELQDRVRSLEEANRENRRIIAALTSRIPQLEAPSETRESPETATVEPERAEPRPTTEGTREPSQERRSWWRRMFGP